MTVSEKTRPAPDAARRVGIVGGGLIGAGWAAYFLARGLAVDLYDPSAAARGGVEEAIAAAWPAMRRAGIAATAAVPRPAIYDTLAAVCRDADYIQECGPEDVALKRRLMAEIATAAGPDIIIASSSSSLLPSDYQPDAAHPERILAAHPFNPPSLVPLVEVAGGSLTAPEAVDWTMAFFNFVGKAPVRVLKETQGYIANRMASALYREAVDLVASGVASVADVDAAIRNGPGLRWAAMGPHLLYHLGGGAGGYRHYLDHLGAAQERRWASLKTAPLTPELKAALVAGVESDVGGRDLTALAAERDRLLAAVMIALRNETTPGD